MGEERKKGIGYMGEERQGKLWLKKEQVYQGSLILVNSLHGYREQKGIDLVPVCDGTEEILMEAEAAQMLRRLLTDIDGWKDIVPVSGWRSRAEQQRIWADSLAENGLAFTETYVAVPDHSEHQTGLAIDLGQRQEEMDFIRPDFPYEGICQTFRERAAEYGFIERYPSGKETVTGIGHEPWHFCYVGAPHARIMERERLTLEEYMVFLEDYCYGVRPYVFEEQGCRAEVSWMKDGDAAPELREASSGAIVVSGNNVDGFIITQWMPD
ncbi:MAG: M15 family metallopeptidase [Roseburia sp.]|nr:M15 family metallopeptidase [Roseburia sp.]